jgi:hypothetical protein
VWTLTEAFGFV